MTPSSEERTVARNEGSSERGELVDRLDDVRDVLGDIVGARTRKAEAAARLEVSKAQLADRFEDVRDVVSQRATAAGAEFVERARERGSDLAERAGPASAELMERARRGGADLAERAGPAAADLMERAGKTRDELTERWHELEEDLPVDTEKVGRQVERGLWQGAQVALAGLLVLPKLLVRLLGSLGDLSDDVAKRGVDVGERAREAAAVIPPSRRERRRGALRTAAWGGAGFGIGLGVGWFLGRRERPIVSYEPTDVTEHLRTATETDVIDPAEAEAAAPDQEAGGATT